MKFLHCAFGVIMIGSDCGEMVVGGWGGGSVFWPGFEHSSSHDLWLRFYFWNEVRFVPEINEDLMRSRSGSYWFPANPLGSWERPNAGHVFRKSRSQDLTSINSIYSYNLVCVSEFNLQMEYKIRIMYNLLQNFSWPVYICIVKLLKRLFSLVVHIYTHAYICVCFCVCIYINFFVC